VRLDLSDWIGVNMTVPGWITRATLTHGDKPAIVTSSRALTYQQLNDGASRIAQILRSKGVDARSVVGVFLERSAAAVTAMLGSWKAGAAYMPLEIANPDERIGGMLRDCGPAVVITRSSLRERVPSGPWRVVDLEADLEEYPPDTDDIVSDPNPGDLAYVIYTSGSTGRPKGVEITHSNLCNLVTWHNSAFGLRGEDRCSQVASLAFDAAVWELWPALSCGASVHLPGEACRTDASALQSWLVDKQITVCFVPTPMAEQMILRKWPSATKLRIMLTGGDTLRKSPVKDLPFQVVNNYGPTECTVVATSGVVANQQRTGLPSIGKPIQGTNIHIVDERGNKVAAGETGEMYIGGAGVGRGYRNAPELTADRFIADTFSARPGSLIYRTGDRGRYLPNGDIEFLGRLDEQIKIRGYRIEPSEITNKLSLHPDVEASAIVGRERTEQDKFLVAYLVVRPGAALTSSSLQAFLHDSLPAYMIPRLFVAVERLPVTLNGKVDTAALPAPDDENTLPLEPSAQPPTVIENDVVGILKKLLGVRDLGLRDNFFLLGGHSLLAAQLMSSVREGFKVDLPLRAIFEHPTASALSAEIARQMTSQGRSVAAGGG